jgi:hypothetical protein
MEEIVYFACNDWHPTPKEADNLCYRYLEPFTIEDTSKLVNKTSDEVDEWVLKNKMCINCDVIDMSISFYITAPKSVFETYFKELLPFIKTEPYDFLFKGDKQIFLEYKEENFGINFIPKEEWK